MKYEIAVRAIGDGDRASPIGIPESGAWAHEMPFTIGNMGASFALELPATFNDRDFFEYGPGVEIEIDAIEFHRFEQVVASEGIQGYCWGVPDAAGSNSSGHSSFLAKRLAYKDRCALKFERRSKFEDARIVYEVMIDSIASDHRDGYAVSAALYCFKEQIMSDLRTLAMSKSRNGIALPLSAILVLPVDDYDTRVERIYHCFLSGAREVNEGDYYGISFPELKGAMSDPLVIQVVFRDFNDIANTEG